MGEIMKFFTKQSDGGKDSGVTAYTLFEIKSLASVMLLHFRPGTREAYHSHAFKAWTLWLKGQVTEDRLVNPWFVRYGFGRPRFSFTPFRAGDWKVTTRENMHRVVAGRNGAWALTIRGPWSKTWQEYKNGKFVTLAHGRKVVNESI